MSIQPRSTVRWESGYMAGRYFTGHVLGVAEDMALVADERRRWPPLLVRVKRLEYVQPIVRGMRK